MNNQTMPCPSPDCDSEIIFDAQTLISGASFECTKCKTKVKISESSMNDVRKAYDKFTELKNKLSK